MTVDVEKDGTKSYDITVASIVVNNLATNLHLKYSTADAMVVRLSGPKEVLDAFEANTKVSIDLNEYTKPGKYTVPVQIDIPEECSLMNSIYVMVELSEAE